MILVRIWVTQVTQTCKTEQMQTYNFFISLCANSTLKEKVTIKHIQVKDECVEVFMGKYTAACVLKLIAKVSKMQ